MILLFLSVSFIASTVGAICGIGGGVIIKPVLDALGDYPVATINFISGCTVLAMTCYSVMRSFASRERSVNASIGIPLGVGSVAGGLAGNIAFQYVSGLLPHANTVGAVQATLLIIIVLMTMAYTVRKSRIKNFHVKDAPTCFFIGCMLGILSSFLGIGGGPINLMVMGYFFDMDSKTAAQNSLFIILFSQFASTLRTIALGCPSVDVLLLGGMVACGILGGAAGRVVNKRLSAQNVDVLFMCLMGVIIIVNVYNIAKFAIL